MIIIKLEFDNNSFLTTKLNMALPYPNKVDYSLDVIAVENPEDINKFKVIFLINLPIVKILVDKTTSQKKYTRQIQLYLEKYPADLVPDYFEKYNQVNDVKIRQYSFMDTETELELKHQNDIEFGNITNDVELATEIKITYARLDRLLSLASQKGLTVDHWTSFVDLEGGAQLYSTTVKIYNKSEVK